MGRAPCCDKASVKKGPWSPEEDAKLKAYIEEHGTGGLKRCGKSCRLRWLNYLRPNIKHGDFSPEEDRIICSLYISIGSRWSVIAAQLPGRTDNNVKNYWNTKLKKKLFGEQRRELYERLNEFNGSLTLSASAVERLRLQMQLRGRHYRHNPPLRPYNKILRGQCISNSTNRSIASEPISTQLDAYTSENFDGSILNDLSSLPGNLHGEEGQSMKGADGETGDLNWWAYGGESPMSFHHPFSDHNYDFMAQGYGSPYDL